MKKTREIIEEGDLEHLSLIFVVEFMLFSEDKASTCVMLVVTQLSFSKLAVKVCMTRGIDEFKDLRNNKMGPVVDHTHNSCFLVPDHLAWGKIKPTVIH